MRILRTTFSHKIAFTTTPGRLLHLLTDSNEAVELLPAEPPLPCSFFEAPAEFLFPTHPDMPRTAVLAVNIRPRRRVRVFISPFDPQLARYHPEALAGPVRALREAALSIRSGGLQFSPLKRAIIAFTSLRSPGIPEADRDLFWEVFGVPVYEQILGSRGELLAWECDAHCGLHFRGDAEALITGAASGGLLRIDKAICGCGEPGARLITLVSSEGEALAGD